MSSEHVLDIVARLTTAPAPDHVETTLVLSEPPRADTGRYDSLRDWLEVIDHA